MHFYVYMSSKRVITGSEHIRRVGDVGRLVAVGRRSRHVPQEHFARQLGVSRKTLSDLERGVAENVSLNTALQALALAGFTVVAAPHRPPALTEVMEQRAKDLARADELSASSAP